MACCCMLKRTACNISGSCAVPIVVGPAQGVASRTWLAHVPCIMVSGSKVRTLRGLHSPCPPDWLLEASSFSISLAKILDLFGQRCALCTPDCTFDWWRGKSALLAPCFDLIGCIGELHSSTPGRFVLSFYIPPSFPASSTDQISHRIIHRPNLFRLLSPFTYP